MVEHVLLKTLERHGIVEIDVGDEPLPGFHEIVNEIESESEKDVGKIKDIIKKGYTLSRKVLRPAQVTVL
jgi:molecular chaperone GrpE (heat shock protein)